MADNDDILKRIQQQAYAQAQGTGGEASALASPADLAQQCLGGPLAAATAFGVAESGVGRSSFEGKLLLPKGTPGLIVMEAPPTPRQKHASISEYSSAVVSR